MLRCASHPDMACVAELRADTALQHLLLANPGPQPADDPIEEAVAWVSRRETAGFFRVIAAANNEAAGFVQIFDINRKNRFGWLSIALAAWARGVGMGSTALAATEKAAKLELGLRKVLLQVRNDNTNAIRLYEREHWHLVGSLKEQYDDGAALHDVLIFEKLLAEV